MSRSEASLTCTTSHACEQACADREPGALSEARAAELMRLGLLMAITMTLHNAPEGFAVRGWATLHVVPCQCKSC